MIHFVVFLIVVGVFAVMVGVENWWWERNQDRADRERAEARRVELVERARSSRLEWER